MFCNVMVLHFSICSYIPDTEGVFLADSEVWQCSIFLLLSESEGNGRAAGEPGNQHYGPISLLTASQVQSQKAGRQGFEAQQFSEASIKYSECFIPGCQINDS